jgi:FG-GAP-like repeat
VSDLDQNGHLDIVVTSVGSRDVGVFWNHGDGTLGARDVYPSRSFPTGVAIADINGFGYADIIVCDDANLLTVVLNEVPGQIVSSVKINHNVMLEITINNLNAVPLTEVSFVDVLPDILSVQSVNIYGTGCVVATSDTASISLSSGTVSSVCVYRALVKGILAGKTSSSVVVSSKSTYDAKSNVATLEVVGSLTE